MTRQRKKPKVLVVSGVMPYPRTAAQQVRVYNTLVALRPAFDITFLTLCKPGEVDRAQREMASVADSLITLPSVTQRHGAARAWHKLAGAVYSLVTGLKASNYILGEVELAPQRIAAHCRGPYDLVLFEYWHTYANVRQFRQIGIPCVLDMHDVLWQAYDSQLAGSRSPWVRSLRARRVRAYRRREEAAWMEFDALIAISAGEAAYTRSVVPGKPVLVAPMGIDLSKWSYSWSATMPRRVAFYGSLGGSLNHQSVLRCARRIMPLIWQHVPDTEFWIVGANPSADVIALQADPRIHVTGFAPDVASVLATMRVVLCPWRGTFGFRSRVVEAMAVGTPVVATPDAVFGMGLEGGQGLLLAEQDGALAEQCRMLLQDDAMAQQMSLRARAQIEERFGFDVTYGSLAEELRTFVEQGAMSAGLNPCPR
jgi:glycosyltransferase involved in cell wall biosynthesis